MKNQKTSPREIVLVRLTGDADSQSCAAVLHSVTFTRCTPFLFYPYTSSVVPEIMMDDTRIREIETMIREMNRCWTTGWHEEEFRKFIHPDAVAIVPTTPGRVEGKEAYVAGWRSFAEATVIHEWKESDHKIQLYAGGKCAVATYFFSITFTMGGTRQTMKGRDMFFLVKEGGRWLVAADQFSPEPFPA